MEKTAVEIILDENNDENITLSYGDSEEEIEFEQIAVVELDDDIFAILRPLDVVEGLEDDDILVFKIDAKKKTLELVDDEETIDEVIEACLEEDEDEENE